MALDPSTNATMAGKVTPADASYPYASAKDETAPGNNDGTPYFKARADDIFGFFQSLLAKAGVVPNGSADSVTNPQYLESLEKLFERSTVRVITADEVYNPPAGVKRLEWQVIGAGGSGGSSATVSASPFGDYSGSSGGGGGAYVFKNDTELDGPYTITIGVGGASPASGPNAGNAGTLSSVVSASLINLVANGGVGGDTYGPQSSQGSASAVKGGAASGGDINADGCASSRFYVRASNDQITTSLSGASFFGGSLENASSAAGFDNDTPGGGGGGIRSAPGGGGEPAHSGGSGGPGIVILREFYGQDI